MCSSLELKNWLQFFHHSRAYQWGNFLGANKRETFSVRMDSLFPASKIARKLSELYLKFPGHCSGRSSFSFWFCKGHYVFPLQLLQHNTEYKINLNVRKSFQRDKLLLRSGKDGRHFPAKTAASAAASLH